MGRVELRAVGGLELAPLAATLAHHAVPGSEEIRIESADGGVARRAEQRVSYRRLLELDGIPTGVTLHVHPAGVTIEAPGQLIAEASALVAWWFALDTDPAEATRAFVGDPLLGPLVGARPALRPLRHPAGWEASIDTVLGQQVTLASARLFGQRLRTAYSPGAVDGLRPFPTADVLARAPLEELRVVVGLTTARARTVRAVAALFADGFALGPATDPALARSELRRVPGVGPWTVEYLALRALGDDDAFPASDAVVRRALGGAPAQEAERLAQAWRPHRAWATAHLWAGEMAG
ncbi:hypothetical protein MWU75_17335 [Ornithinimicrobium sp. F0845]|uniref:DNA-3-methyladenine glycosylase family protein n=1 Tax=Ornithinimicrobium sp. F0845 TaxID=2926412 RepID=UPI001FF19407|nr:hypothetical protein [Ornithinimicrobium sp. F0845]MCK0113911.1 hypothetical protein [Ornithinimicrobium sp. F0845]